MPWCRSVDLKVRVSASRLREEYEVELRKESSRRGAAEILQIEVKVKSRDRDAKNSPRQTCASLDAAA